MSKKLYILFLYNGNASGFPPTQLSSKRLSSLAHNFHHNRKNKFFMAYYKTIDGVRMDGYLLDKANEAITGGGDGRITKKEAEAMIIAVTFGFGYADVERDTLEYIRDHYQWTDSAKDWFRSQITTWVGPGRI